MENIDFENLIHFLNFSSTTWQLIGSFSFILADIISGIISAIINHNLDSKKMREGLLRKILLIIIIALSFITDLVFNLYIVSKVVCIYIIVMEFVSILENFKKAGIELGKLGELLKLKSEENTINLVLKKESEEKENEK